MTSRTTKQFRDLLSVLPIRVRFLARKAYELFMTNPSHPSLQFKRIHGSQPVYSARINIDYRAVGLLRSNGIVWFWIGSHADYDALLKRM